MKKNWRLAGILVGLFLVSACAPAARPVLSSDPRATGTASLPAPVSPGQSVTYGDLQVEMSTAEITAGYQTEFGSRREPPAGGKFLWVQIRLKNTGPGQQNLPAPEHFSALFGGAEFKPSYGHRQDYPDYTTLKPGLYPGQEVKAWLRFDLPAAATLKALQFAFLPESYQISTAFSPGEYPWGDHPMYLWRCER